MVNWDRAVHPDDRPAYDAFNLALGRARIGGDYRLIGVDGITRWVHDRAACRPRPDGTFEVSGIVSDVTERRRLEDELAEHAGEEAAHSELERARADAELRASTDELTGTFNRRHFAQIATETLAADAAPVRPAAARRRPLQAGQRRLRARRGRRRPDRSGHRLSACLEPGDCLARWGGEEFAILLPGAHSEDALVRRAEQLPQGGQRLADRARGRAPRPHDLRRRRPVPRSWRHPRRAPGTGGQLSVRRQAPRTGLRLAPPGRRAHGRSAQRRAQCGRGGACPGVRVQPAGGHPAGARRGGGPPRRPDGRTAGAARSRRRIAAGSPAGCTTSGSSPCPSTS